MISIRKFAAVVCLFSAAGQPGAGSKARALHDGAMISAEDDAFSQNSSPGSMLEKCS